MSKSAYFRFIPSGEIVEVAADSILAQQYSEKSDSMERLTAKAGAAAYRQQLVRDLTELVQLAGRPADHENGTPAECVVYGLIRDVSRSGMARSIDFFVIADNQLISITYKLHVVLGYRMAKHSGLYVQGCGMDMIFEVVSNLQRAIPGLPQLRHRQI
jgi:hypothetical protein